MSRLIIKGLPGRYDDKQLRDLFTPLGDVTDARVIKTRDGRSRRFGFVGFRTKQQAARARTAMHRAYVDTSPVQVNLAFAVGDEAIPRPWSRYSVGSSRYEKENPVVSGDDGAATANSSTIGMDTGASGARQKRIGALDDKDDAEFATFEKVVAPKSTGTETAVASRVREKSQMVKSRRNGTKGELIERKHVTFLDDSDDSDADDLYQDLNKDKKEKEVTNDSTNNAKASSSPEEGNKTALNAAVSDLDYFKSKVVSKDNLDDGSESSDSSGDESEATDTHDDKETDHELNDPKDKSIKQPTSTGEKTLGRPPQAMVKIADSKRDNVDPGETGRLMVRNLAFSVTEEELEEIFEQFGALSEVHIVRDSASGKSRGLAFIQFSIAEEAAKALAALDGSFQSGRIIHVLPAKRRPTITRAQNAGGVAAAGWSKFKAGRAEGLAETARSGGDSSAQHALHVSADAAAEIAAERHGVSKGDLLGAGRGESGMAAVRVAVAEAAVQAEARAFMMRHGIDLEVAEDVAMQVRAGVGARVGKEKGKGKMSRTAILVKGLPAGTERGELESVFGKFGKIVRLVVAPSGLLAVIQFATASVAKLAFNSLAYTRFKNTPLYLQWLAEEALKKDAAEGEEKDEGENKSEDRKRHEEEGGDASQNLEQVGSGGEKEVNEVEDGDVGGCSVYVKNLSFETRDKELKAHFEEVLRKRRDVVSSLRCAKVATKRGVEGKEGVTLSMGFGFLEFDSRMAAQEAVKIGQGSKLAGHVLQLQLSQGGGKGEGAEAGRKRKRRTAVKGKAGPKVVVRNIAFEATRRDVRGLFGAFGQVKSVRMPRRMDGSHRGFAFVEFVSRNEAVAAVDAVGGTHLYGRHVVVEYAQDGEEGEVGAEAEAKLPSVEVLEERAGRQAAAVKKRRIMGVDAGGGGGSGGGDGGDADVAAETDGVAQMRDELYG